MTDPTFTADLLSTWAEPDATTRRRIIDRLWAEDGELSVSSTGQTLHGTDAIAAHIGAVHDDLIAAKGLAFSYDQEITAGDALLLRWSMAAPDGTVVGRGADVVARDDAGRVTSVHMFMGVN